jgi:hypothetical protein
MLSQFKDAGPDTGSSRERTPATSSTFTGRAITIPWEKMKSNPTAGMVGIDGSAIEPYDHD